jgi:ribonuclease R
VSRRGGKDHLVAADHCADARTGELVLAEQLPGRHYGLPLARIEQRLGPLEGPQTISLIAIHANFIPTQFSEAALARAEAARPAELGERSDLRALPLVTIDGARARDFDDAVWAEADPDPANPGGWHILVAIADVAHYVRHGDALDRDARERGNSVYFPDRVVPMLPEALSNGLCSLKPGEERACLAVHIYLSAAGEIIRHKFVRGLMRSAARLEYGQVQRALDGHADETLAPLMETVVAPLKGAFEALLEARQARGVLELDLPEREVTFAEDGTIERIAEAPRYDSHRLIEEFMIAANVAAAETLEAKGAPCVYRVHDQPDGAKLEELRDVLAGLGLKLSRNRHITPQNINHILAKAAESPNRHLVNTLVLRAQARAEYASHNYGHFGLALERYAHFTSPIRRYADLLVHRALIAALGFGGDGLPAGAEAELGEICSHISGTERRAIAAERDAMDRYAAAFLAAHIDAEFTGRVSGVARFGIFVELDESGADGLIPARSLGGPRPRFDPRRHSLSVGAAHVTLGDRVRVRLVEADPLSGATVLELLAVGDRTWNTGPAAKRNKPAPRGKRGKRRKS